MSTNNSNERLPERLMSVSDVATMLGLNIRHVLQLPIKRVALGHRTIRYRREDVEAFVDELVLKQDTRKSSTEAEPSKS
jgi:hypothetical protein